jgi:phenylpyruvate tautomerase PptA (4-oxalocrotonate tautomerase family)
MLSRRYNHDEASVCVAVQHSACMITGGTFDGTYMLTITSVSLISPTVNKRNAALITEWLAANLGVPPHRGYIRFADTDFANYAVGGYTVLDLMQKEELARIGTAEKTAVVREMSVKRSESRLNARRERKGVSLLVSPEEEETTMVAPLSQPQPPISRGALFRKKSRSMFNLFAKTRQAAPVPA